MGPVSSLAVIVQDGVNSLLRSMHNLVLRQGILEFVKHWYRTVLAKASLHIAKVLYPAEIPWRENRPCSSQSVCYRQPDRKLCYNDSVQSPDYLQGLTRSPARPVGRHNLIHG